MSPEGRDGKGLQVQQLCWWGILLRQNEVAEGDWQNRLALQPLVRHYLSDSTHIHVRAFPHCKTSIGHGTICPQDTVEHSHSLQ